MAVRSMRLTTLRRGLWVSSVAILMVGSMVSAQASRLSDKLCNRTTLMMQGLTKQQVDQMSTTPAAARVVHDCYRYFATDIGKGEACLRTQCTAVVVEGVVTTREATKEESIENCLDSAEDLIVINKTIELNYLNFMKVCRSPTSTESN